MTLRTKSQLWLAVTAFSLLLTGCKEKPLFERLDSSDTGITFANTITDSDTLNILNYQYIYNGGGVGVGDFNGDQKPDVFFAGNQVSNKLYVNTGDMKFRDVTQSAGVGGGGRWCSGVSVVDVNADGKLDVYISNTLHKSAARRANLLYVNQGNDADGAPRFREMATDYGIADTTYSTHSAFFDYDNDGDLDLYVLVDQIFDEKTTANLRAQKADGTSPNVDHLYRNDFDPKRGHAFFTDVSKQAGILFEGFGLGVNICDINRDGWKDIYVTNDFASRDLLYVNNHNGTFTNRVKETFRHTSYSAMGNDVADINNDGLADIVAMDMLPEDNLRKKSLMGGSNYFVYQEWDRLGYEYQYARNTLQLNQGVRPSGVRPSGVSLRRTGPSGVAIGDTSGADMPVFSETSMLAGVAETEWSWSPLLVDVDHDGYRDLLVTNGFPRDVTDRDFTNYYSGVNNLLTDAMRMELTTKMPQVKVGNYAFRNKGNAQFENVTDRWGMTEPSFSNGAAYADFDGDGDLDYVVNNINAEAFVYRNTLTDKKPQKAHYLRIKFAGDGANPMGLGAIVEYDLPGGQKEFYEHTPYRGFLSSVEPVAHLGLGEVTTIKDLKVTWPGGRAQVLPSVNADQTITVRAADARLTATEPAAAPQRLLQDVTDSLGLTYRHEDPDFIDFNQQKTLLHKFSQYGPALAAGDVNGDERVDLVVGGSSNHSADVLLQQPTGRFVRKPLPAKLSEDAGLLLFDADADGDLDLYAASGSTEFQPAQMAEALKHRLYLNDGTGNFTLAPDALPNIHVSGSCVKAADFDHDGDLDLFVGGRVEPNKYPMPVASYLLRNDRGKFTNVTTQLAPVLAKGGLTCDALWTDFDNDGDADLMLASEWAPLTMLRNDKGRLTPLDNSGLADKSGFWNSLTPGDFDNDGDVDYIAGNLGQNTLLRASPERPVRMYAGDFDNNGFYDAFTSVYFKNPKGQYDEYPYFGWDDMVRQMIGIKKRYVKYGAFGQVTMNEILTEEERNQALKLSVTYTTSSYIENKGNGQFEVRPLPAAAQAAPVFGTLAQDVDGDGNLDAVLVGNDYGSDLVAGRMDAFDGLILKGDGKGGFVPLTMQRSGFYVPGNAKALVNWPDAGGHSRLAVSENRGPLRVFAVRRPQTFAAVDGRTMAVGIRLKNGRTRRHEVPFGTSFYSQSARGVWLLPGETITKRYPF